MKTRPTPQYVLTDEQLCQRSPRLRDFVKERSTLNAAVESANNQFVKRFFNLDTNAYLDGALAPATKELLGLACSAVLRCDDCILYHITQSCKLGVPRAQIEETLNIALMVGGSIVIPHLRRAYATLDEVFSE